MTPSDGLLPLQLVSTVPPQTEITAIAPGDDRNGRAGACACDPVQRQRPVVIGHPQSIVTARIIVDEPPRAHSTARPCPEE
jgi:hypothetical protein